MAAALANGNHFNQLVMSCKQKSSLWITVLALVLGVYADFSISATQEVKLKPKLKSKEKARTTNPVDGAAEARLIEVYRMIGAADSRNALRKAEKLVGDYPNFQLAQLVYGDLLAARSRPLQNIGDVPSDMAKIGAQNLMDLRSNKSRHLMLYRPNSYHSPAAINTPLQLTQKRHVFISLKIQRQGRVCLPTTIFQSEKPGLEKRWRATSERRWVSTSSPATLTPRP